MLGMNRAAALLYMMLIVLTEAVKTCYQHMSRLIANGTVSTGLNILGCLLNQIQGFHGSLAIKHILQQMLQLQQSYPAGYAFATGLSLTNLQK